MWKLILKYLNWCARPSNHFIAKECEMRQYIDLAPVLWRKGRLNWNDTRNRLGIDINHCDGKYYLTHRLWSRLLFNLATVTLVRFYHYHSLSIVTILWTSHSGKGSHRHWCCILCWYVYEVLGRVNVRFRFRSKYIPARNSIVQSCHSNVKWIADVTIKVTSRYDLLFFRQNLKDRTVSDRTRYQVTAYFTSIWQVTGLLLANWKAP